MDTTTPGVMDTTTPGVMRCADDARLSSLLGRASVRAARRHPCHVGRSGAFGSPLFRARPTGSAIPPPGGGDREREPRARRRLAEQYRR